MLRPARVLFRRPKRPRGAEGRPMLALTPTDDAILKALGRYTYLRVDQLFRLLPGTPRARPLVASTQLPKRPDPHRYLQQRCKRLLDAGYLRRRYLPLASPPRKSPALLWLDRKGIAHVRSLGFPAIAAPKPSDV